MLYRFREAQRAELGLSTKDEKRPYLASLVDTIQDGEKWRYQIIKEVSNLVTKIQDRELGLETGENSAEAPDAGEQFSDTANAVFVDNCRLKADISLEMSPIYRQMEFLLRARSLDNEEARSYANDLLTLYLPSPAALGDFQIRDLNDQINKLLREKHHWERRILELGGPNYMGQSMRLIDEDGREVPGGQRGYRYFGRAKELPGVKELFEPEGWCSWILCKITRTSADAHSIRFQNRNQRKNRARNWESTSTQTTTVTGTKRTDSCWNTKQNTRKPSTDDQNPPRQWNLRLLREPKSERSRRTNRWTLMAKRKPRDRTQRRKRTAMKRTNSTKRMWCMFRKCRRKRKSRSFC